MSFIEEISWMSKSGFSDIELLEYIDKQFDEIECEFNGEEYKKPKHNRNLCIDCNVVKTIDYERSTLVCTKCGLCEYYPVNVASYNHTMQPSRRKCIHKRSDNLKVILNQFFYGGKKLVPNDGMETIRDEIHDETNILYNYTIPITIPILECILKKNELTMYKDIIYFMFNVVSSIYDKYKRKGRKSFLNYFFILKKLLIMLERVECAKCIPQLKTHSKQKELERVWELITKDHEWAVALQKRKITWVQHLSSTMLVDAFERIYL